jgi:2-(3-amino-3-carboxypropyl)histidine synthase
MNKKVSIYELDTSTIDAELIKEKYSIIYLQLPEGLQQHSMNIKNFFQDQFNVTIILDAHSCYGSCDLPEESLLKRLNANAVVQIGHVPIPSMNIQKNLHPIFFVNAISTIPIETILNESASHLIGKKIGIVTTAQHLHQIDKIKHFLKKNGFIPLLSKGNSRLFSKGQVLGCNFTSATNITEKVDSFLFFGSGWFHPLGLLLATEKPVVCADPYTNQIIDAKTLQGKKQKILKQRYGAIAIAKQAKTIAIIIGLKPGQMRYHYAIKIQKKVLDAGKKCLLLAADTITPTFIDRFPMVDVFVSTACPRIAIDDYTCYKKPILTPLELKIALKEKEWDEYVFDQILD